MSFSENLKRIRKEKGYMQKDVAKALGVSQPSYAQYENGKRNPKMGTITKLALILKVSAGELLGHPNENAYTAFLMHELEEMDPEDRKKFLNDTSDELDDFLYGDLPEEDDKEPYSDKLLESNEKKQLFNALDLKEFWDNFGKYLRNNNIDFNAEHKNDELGKSFSFKDTDIKYFLTNSQARQLPEMIIENTKRSIRHLSSLNQIEPKE